MDNAPPGYSQPPPQLPVTPGAGRPRRPRPALSGLKTIGYFLGGTVWVVINGSPVVPVGIIGLLGVLSEKKKLATALLVLGGCALGAIGTGISFRYSTHGPMFGIHFNIGLHPEFNRMLMQRRIKRSGVLDEGKAVADRALQAMRAGDAEAFHACFDPIAFSGPGEVKQFFSQFSDKLGAPGPFEYVSAGMVWLPELRKSIYVLYYDVETSKAGRVQVLIGLHETSDGWQLLNISG